MNNLNLTVRAGIIIKQLDNLKKNNSRRFGYIITCGLHIIV